MQHLRFVLGTQLPEVLIHTTLTFCLRHPVARGFDSCNISLHIYLLSNINNYVVLSIKIYICILLTIRSSHPAARGFLGLRRVALPDAAQGLHWGVGPGGLLHVLQSTRVLLDGHAGV